MSHRRLIIDDISVAFGGVQALKNFSMYVDEGETCALIGPNGAGKTSLLNAITGLVQPSHGRVLFAGRRIDRIARHQLVRHGIARTFQNLGSLGRSTVLDHLLLGTHSLGRTGLFSQLLNTRAARAEQARARSVAASVMHRLGLYQHRDRVVADLPYGDRRLVELGRALAAQPRLLLLDEPAAGLSQAQTDALAECIIDLRTTSGIAVLLIEHDMGLVSSVAQRVVVINQGTQLTTGTPLAVRNDPHVQDLYLGI